MIWTTKKPKEAGTYWNKTKHGIQMVVLYVAHSGELRVNCEGDGDYRNYRGKWSKRIPEPQE